jgi:GT2 family glycosyltransferase
MLVRADVFKKIGLFDEDFFLYWEDADFSFRADKAGFVNMVVAASWVYHFEQSKKYHANKAYWLVVSGLIFFKKNTSFWLRPWIRLYLVGRKIKNWRDNKFRRTETAVMVKKAYADFKRVF